MYSYFLLLFLLLRLSPPPPLSSSSLRLRLRLLVFVDQCLLVIAALRPDRFAAAATLFADTTRAAFDRPVPPSLTTTGENLLGDTSATRTAHTAQGAQGGRGGRIARTARGARGVRGADPAPVALQGGRTPTRPSKDKPGPSTPCSAFGTHDAPNSSDSKTFGAAARGGGGRGGGGGEAGLHAGVAHAGVATPSAIVAAAVANPTAFPALEALGLQGPHTFRDDAASRASRANMVSVYV